MISSCKILTYLRDVCPFMLTYRRRNRHPVIASAPMGPELNLIRWRDWIDLTVPEIFFVELTVQIQHEHQEQIRSVFYPTCESICGQRSPNLYRVFKTVGYVNARSHLLKAFRVRAFPRSRSHPARRGYLFIRR